MKEEKKESPISVLWGWGKAWGTELFPLCDRWYYCTVRLLWKGAVFLSFYNDFPHSDLLHAARSAGKYHRKAGPRPDGDDFRYSVRPV